MAAEANPSHSKMKAGFRPLLLLALLPSVSLLQAATAIIDSPAHDERVATGLLVGKLEGETTADRARSALVLYKNDEHPWLYSAALLTQLQLQYAHGSSSAGKFGTADWPDDLSWGDIEVRRFRLGLKAEFAGGLSLFNLTDLHPNFSNGFYKRFPELYLTWTRDDALALSIGKCELKFNREQEYLSTQFPVFERTAVGNMVYGGELTGIWVKGSGVGTGWLYSVGLFSNDRQDEWSRFGGAGAITVSKIGYDYTEHAGVDLAIARLEWLHNTKPGFRNSNSNPASPLFSNAFALSNEMEKGPLSLTAEVLLAEGSGSQADVAAISHMTRWKVKPKIELINVLEAAGSRDGSGIRLPTRYEALAPDVDVPFGSRWHSGYLGVNYYIDGHALKLMTGALYSRMSGRADGPIEGWTWLAGMRLIF